MFEHSIKVRLKVNLTQYHPSLVAGVEGMTVGASGMWSRGSDRFTSVRFSNSGTFDILWESLEIIDQQFLAESAEREKQKWEQLKYATNVVRYIGSKGGFKRLSYEYSDTGGARVHTSAVNRDEVTKLLEFFQQHGIPVREEVWR